MLISQKSKDIIESCRFCWMCRHICPIGNATGQERNGARARALSLSLVERGAEPLSEVAENVYECALCGACTQDCATGFDPVCFTTETRFEIASNAVLPPYIQKLLENVIEYGNIYGEKDYSADLKKEIASLPKEADTLLFLGKDAIYKSPESAISAIKLLKKTGIDFTVLENEPDSGYAMHFLVGNASETKDIMENCAKMLNYKTVICYDGADAKVFLHEYKEMNIDLSAEIKTFPAFVAENLDKLNIKKGNNAYTIQDSHYISRDLDDSESIRKIINVLGENREMLLNKKETVLAGNLIMNEYMPRVMEEVAKRRVINAKNMNAEIIVTENVSEYVLLKKVSDIPVLSVEEAIIKCL